MVNHRGRLRNDERAAKRAENLGGHLDIDERAGCPPLPPPRAPRHAPARATDRAPIRIRCPLARPSRRPPSPRPNSRTPARGKPLAARACSVSMTRSAEERRRQEYRSSFANMTLYAGSPCVATRAIATMPARTAGDSFGQAEIRAARSASALATAGATAGVAEGIAVSPDESGVSLPVSKTGVGFTPPRVRIPLSPLESPLESAVFPLIARVFCALAWSARAFTASASADLELAWNTSAKRWRSGVLQAGAAYQRCDEHTEDGNRGGPLPAAAGRRGRIVTPPPAASTATPTVGTSESSPDYSRLQKEPRTK